MKNKRYLEIKFSPTRLKHIQKIALSGSLSKLKILNGKFEEGFDLLLRSAKKLKSFALDLSKQLPLALAGQVSLKLFSHYEKQSSKKLGIPKGIVLGGVLALMCSLPAAGQTIFVTSTVDGNVNALRSAITVANANSLDGIIYLPNGSFHQLTTADLPSIATTVSGGTLQIICTGTTNAIIDGGGSFRPITMSINSDLTISNITIQNGNALDGGAIYNDGGVLTITSSNIINNNSSDDGGGIYSKGNASVLIQNSTISLNSATQDGGGIYNKSGTLSIFSSTISGNTTPTNGGGIYNQTNSPLTISNSIISGNTSNTSGGGIASFNDVLTIISSSIINNDTGGIGGGLRLSTNLTGTIKDTFISGNTSASSGGGVHIASTSTLTISNSTITGNTSAAGGGLGGGGIANTGNSTLAISSSTISNNQATNNVGGGVFSDNSDMTIQASSLNYNQSNQAGGAIYVTGNATNKSTIITNTTISSNTGSSGGGVFHRNTAGVNILQLDHVTISDNTGTSNIGGLDIALTGADVILQNTVIANNIGVGNDFQFGGTINATSTSNIVETGLVHASVTAIDPLLAPLTLNSGFLVHPLQAGSPAINAGAMIGISTDQLGNTRNGVNPFIGAVEVLEALVACPITVVSTNDAGIGTLRQAINDANANPTDCTIYLTAGTTYTISSNLPIVTGTDVGGKLTIMTSGLPNAIIDGSGASRPITMDINSDLTISNITIQNGSAVDGGGIYNNEGNLTITSSNIINNNATDDGGGIYSKGNASVLIQNSTINLNSAASLGGGIRNNGNSTLSIFSSTISGNTAVSGGGGIYNNSPLTISNTIISGNISNNLGGGIRHSNFALTIHSSSIINNQVTNASQSGGGIVINGANPAHIENTLISGNTVTGNGGGIFNFNNSTLTILSSTISGNTSNTNGGGAYNNNSPLSISNSTISLNSATLRGGGIFNQNSSPLTISSSIISGNTSNTNGGGVYNNNNSPLSISNSTISLNSATLRGGGIFNQNSSPLTISSSTISGNTSNNHGGGIFNKDNSSLTISSSSISSNASGNDGGGIWNTNSYLNVQFSTLAYNQSSKRGGAVMLSHTIANYNTTLQNSTISGNISITSGGGIYHLNTNVQPTYVTLRHVTISDNSGAVTGGFANQGNADITIQNSILANSTGADFTQAGGTLNPATTNNIVADGSLVGAIAADPKLDVLQVFSGSLIQPFLFGSSALNGGDNTLGILVDQLGTVRIGLPDIGAFERAGVPCFNVTVVAPVTIVWLGCVSSDWSDAANWSTGVVPSSSDTILLPSFAPILVINTTVSCRKIIVQKGTRYFVTKGNKIFFTK